MTKSTQSDIFFKLSSNAKKVLLISSRLADYSANLPSKNKSSRNLLNKVELKHIFAAMLLVQNCLATRVLSTMRVDTKATLNRLGYGFLTEGDTNLKINGNGILADKVGRIERDKKIELDEQVKKVLSNAYHLANKYDLVYVGTEHIMLALLSLKGDPFIEELRTSGLVIEQFMKVLSMTASYPMGILVKPENFPGQEGETPLLSQLGIDVTQMAKDGRLDPIIGREKEIDQIINTLSRRKKNNPIIVGEAGVGKTALVEGLAQRIIAGTVPGSLIGSRIYSIDIPSIIAGSKMRGDVEEKVLEIINEVRSNKNIILFIDEIQNILTAGAPGSGFDISSILKPALLSGDFRCIGATTTEDYTRYFEEDSALARRFQQVLVEEPTVDDSIEILTRIKPILEKHHNIRISKEALVGAVKLSDRFVVDRYLPDKAIDLLDEATASRRLEVEVKYKGLTSLDGKLGELDEKTEKAVKAGRLEQAIVFRKQKKELENRISRHRTNMHSDQFSKKYEVGIDTVRNVIAKWTGIPVATINRDESSALLNLDRDLEKKVVGQKEAVKLVAGAIKRARSGISAVDRPWASFLFLGPTGVGKTELAKVLTAQLFGDEDRLIQIDMSELMEMHSVSKLIGSPPGYVGYREGGQLTEEVRKHPHSVILFDEVEKAHPDVLNVLLQILEYGHLTDGKGRKVNFKNTVVILTSNIGAEEIRKSKILGFITDVEARAKGKVERSDVEIEKAYDSMRDELMKQLKETVRPELLNRLDDIVIFRALTRKDAEKIVNILVDELNGRLKDEKFEVILNQKAIDWVVQEGFSEEYGARPLRRLLQDKIENQLADWILKHGGRKHDRVEKLHVSVSGGKIVVKEKN